MEPTPLDDLAAHAHETHVVVVGGGIGGLVAAHACAKVGIRVTVLEASDRLGGAVRTIDLAGVRVDLGAEGYATRGGAVRGLVDELDLTDAVAPTAPRAEWISGLPGGAAPVPQATVRGIPENPWEESIRRVIGRRGTWRAYLDRLRPPLTIGQERSLGRLVRTRMGDLVLDRLVAPLSLGGFSIHPDDVDVELVAPGLNAALTRTGSLAGAVMQLRADRGPKSAGDGLEGIDGGMSRLIDALHDRLRTLGAGVRLSSPVDALERRDDGRWTVLLAAADAEEIDIADAVILAAGADEAHRLLAAVVPALERTPVTALEVVTLVVDSAALADAPARTAVYPVPGTAVAASVTDSTARWPWMRRPPSPGRACSKSRSAARAPHPRPRRSMIARRPRSRSPRRPRCSTRPWKRLSCSARTVRGSRSRRRFPRSGVPTRPMLPALRSTRSPGSRSSGRGSPAPASRRSSPMRSGNPSASGAAPSGATPMSGRSTASHRRPPDAGIGIRG